MPIVLRRPITTGGSGPPPDPPSITPTDWDPFCDFPPGSTLPSGFLFTENFTDASLDTTKWTRVQSSVGNVEIDATNNRLHMQGNAAWGTNGLFSVQTFTKAVGLTFQCDVIMAAGIPGGLIVGFHDGAGQSFSDFAHGVDFSDPNLVVFENGTNRGSVGTVQSPGVWRIKIRITSATAAAYTIQGRSSSGVFGTTTYETLTPGSTSSATTPLAVGASVETNNASMWLRNIIVWNS